MSDGSPEDEVIRCTHVTFYPSTQVPTVGDHMGLTDICAPIRNKSLTVYANCIPVRVFICSSRLHEINTAYAVVIPQKQTASG